MESSDSLQSISLLVNGFIIVILNTFESYHLIKPRRKSHETLILSLSISDCIVGFGTFTSKLFVNLLDHYQLSTYEEEKTYLIKKIAEAPIWFSVYLSLFHIIAITVDRAIAVAYPTRHRVLITPWRIKIYIIIVWLASTIIILVKIVLVFMTSLKSIFIWIRFFAAGFIIGVGFVVALSYFFIIKKAIYERKKSIRNIHGNIDEKKIMRKERRLLFTSFAIVLSFVVCMLPSTIEAVMLKEESYMAEFLVVSNSLVNSLTYFYGRYLNCRRGGGYS